MTPQYDIFGRELPKYDELVKEVRDLKEKVTGKVQISDIPMFELGNKLEQTWRPNVSAWLGPESISPELLQGSGALQVKRGANFVGSGTFTTPVAVTDGVGQFVRLQITPPTNGLWSVSFATLVKTTLAAWHRCNLRIVLTPADVDGFSTANTGVMHNSGASDWLGGTVSEVFKLQRDIQYTAQAWLAPPLGRGRSGTAAISPESRATSLAQSRGTALMANKPKTHCVKGHDLTSPDSFTVTAQGHRQCQQCRTARKKPKRMAKPKPAPTCGSGDRPRCEGSPASGWASGRGLCVRHRAELLSVWGAADPAPAEVQNDEGLAASESHKETHS
jgi:hypothetical protein